MRNLLLLLILICCAVACDAQSKNNLRQNIINQNTYSGQQTRPANGNPGDGPLRPTGMGAVSPKDSTDKSGTTPTSSTNTTKKSGDNVIRIGIILPFEAQSTSEKIYNAMSDKEGTKNEGLKIKEHVQEALDFNEGLKYALSTHTVKLPVEIYTFDSQNNDSVVQELVKNDTLKICDIIIGPTTSNQAKTVAAYCKKNGIINIQPFVASKAFSSENPYLVRFMPTIDAHLQKEYEMVTDSFDEANIVIMTTKRERDISAAKQLDTLFKNYNDINTHKLKYSFFNISDSTVLVAKRSLSYYLVPKERNVIMMTCYDEPVVNSHLRTIKENVTVFGMPTWIEAEQIRADYLNKAEPYFTDNYYVDTSRSQVKDFVSGYTNTNSQHPSRFSYLGYDAMTYLTVIFNKYGKSIKQGFDNESYDGLGFSFHISPVIRNSKTSGEPVVNYYTNTAMHLFQVSDYHVLLVR